MGESFKENEFVLALCGPPSIVTHLHGGEVPSVSGGNPESWFTPGQAKTGLGFTTNVYNYPDAQEGTTLWFHDHALGITRINVYPGLGAFYPIRDRKIGVWRVAILRGAVSRNVIAARKGRGSG